MSALGGHVDEYLRLRRSLGFKLEREGRWLADLAAYLDAAAGASTLTSDLVIGWAQQRARAGPNGWAKRLGVARKFAAWLQTIVPATQVPPSGVFPARRHRPTPYMWSQHDICVLLERAGALRPALRAVTYETIFGLLAVSGMFSGVWGWPERLISTFPLVTCLRSEH
jgi:integrase/recombinase XerD